MMSLRGGGGALDVRNSVWEWLLDMAHFYGWSPEGTEPNDELWRQVAESHGEQYKPSAGRSGYFTNDYQYVTDSDAASIADALGRALEDETSAPVRLWSQARIDYLRGFVAFCRAGRFYIG